MTLEHVFGVFCILGGEGRKESLNNWKCGFPIQNRQRSENL